MPPRDARRGGPARQRDLHLQSRPRRGAQRVRRKNSSGGRAPDSDRFYGQCLLLDSARLSSHVHVVAGAVGARGAGGLVREEGEPGALARRLVLALAEGGEAGEGREGALLRRGLGGGGAAAAGRGGRRARRAGAARSRRRPATRPPRRRRRRRRPATARARGRRRRRRGRRRRDRGAARGRWRRAGGCQRRAPAAARCSRRRSAAKGRRGRRRAQS